MAGLADGRCAMSLVASETNTHGGDAGRLGHALHLGHLPVAHLAFHPGFEVFAMRPVDSWQDFVNAYPGDRLSGF